MEAIEVGADSIHRDSTVAVIHDHRAISADLPLMIAGGVTARVYQATLDEEAGYEVSKTRTEGWLQLATRGMEGALREIEAHHDHCILARTASDIRQAKRAGKVAILLGGEGA